MTLIPGTRLGSYEVVGAVGAGGMGEVYRARDAKLQRDVAIKILPALFARDPERLARFEREARTLAALNHPRIAHVYGLVDLPAESGGGHGLVLEFVEGEDLSGRIARGGRIPLDEALPIALQISEALEAAHGAGIIHRDLKPGNIKVRGDGTVTVLDFGLAKALAPGDAGSPPIDNSPTLTSPFQMSQLGVILGTAAYMAPEQAKGRAVDKRADIWAFGCVLYEMLTGRRAFPGEDVTDTLAAIVRADPDWSALPADTPGSVRTLLRRCLAKDPRERLPDIGAARLEIADAMRGASPSAAPPRRARLPWVIAGLAVTAALAIAVAAIVREQGRPLPDLHVFKSVIVPPTALTGAPALRFNLSPDGRRLAFVAPDEAGRTLLWVRPLDSFAAQPLTGTLNATAPFWSPDGRWIAFVADGKLKKVELASGSIVTLCDASQAPPSSWSRFGVIVFTGGVASGLMRVPDTGGTPAPATKLGEGERIHISPFFLPDGRHFIYTASSIGAGNAGLFVGSIDSLEAKRLLDVSSNAMYADGHLLYLRDGALLAHPFDPDTTTLKGTPVPVAEGIQANLATGTGAFSVSQSGVLAYQTGTYIGTQLVWYDRSGRVVSMLGEPRGYRDVELSPDGASVSATITAGTQSSVWIFDVAKNLGRPLTFNDEFAQAAVWTRDGTSLIYGARRGGATDIYRRSATGGGPEELLLHDQFDKLPLSFTPDGGTLLYRVPRAAAGGELWLLPLSGTRTPRPFAPGDAHHVPAQVSPDGRWLAYVSDENGRRDVFVTSFPEGRGKWLVSTNGGDNPQWRADGRELFFAGTDSMASVEVSALPDRFQCGPVQTLFPMRVPAAALATRSTYVATRDGQRFLVNTWDPRSALTPISVIVNWPAALAR